MPDLPLTQLDYMSWLFLQLAMVCYPQLFDFNSIYLIMFIYLYFIILRYFILYILLYLLQLFELKSNSCGHQVMANCRKSQDR